MANHFLGDRQFAITLSNILFIWGHFCRFLSPCLGRRNLRKWLKGWYSYEDKDLGLNHPCLRSLSSLKASDGWLLRTTIHLSREHVQLGN